MPLAHLERLARAARAARAGDPDAAPVETLLIARRPALLAVRVPRATARAVARFLATALGGPLAPDEAAAIAAAHGRGRTDPGRRGRFAAVEAQPGGFRTLARVVAARGDPAARRRRRGAGESAALDRARPGAADAP